MISKTKNTTQLENIEMIAADFVPPDTRVLDLGCADGRIGTWLEKHRNCTVLGVEIDKSLAKTAAGKISKVIQGDLEDSKTQARIMRDAKFDVIFASNILEHLRGPAICMKKIIKALKKNGVVVVILPNIAHFSTRFELFRGRFNYIDSGILAKTHLRFFTVKSAIEFIEKACNLTIEHIDYELTPLPIVHRVFNAIPSVGNRIEKKIYRAFPNFFAYQIAIKSHPMESQEMEPVKLVLGCGPLPMHPMHYKWIDDSWILTDLHPKDPNVLKMDAQSIDYPNKSVDALYASHLLEHIGFKQTLETLKEWHRVLKPGGTITINVPDFEWACERFLANYKRGKATGSKHFKHYSDFWEIFFGNHIHDGEYHKAGFTQKTLQEALNRVGFKNVRVEKAFDAHEMGVLIAEAKERV